MEIDNCQKVYIYRMSLKRIEELDRRIVKLERWTDTEVPNVRWVQELMCYRHEKKKLSGLLTIMENALLGNSCVSFR